MNIKKYTTWAAFILLVVVLSIRIKSVPAMGMILNPFTGWVQNAKSAHTIPLSKIKNHKLGARAEIHYDTNYVPHIYAKTDSDLYYLQGYIMAKDRLWQLDMQARSGMGELAEVVGEVAIPNDRLMRRLGLKDAANTLINQLKIDGSYHHLVRYAEGVNDYVSKMDDREMPIEYKLMGFSPREYKPLYIAVLLKTMSMRLTAMEADIENTNFMNQFGKEDFDLLFPNFYESESPICPAGTSFQSAQKATTDSISPSISKGKFAQRILDGLERGLGSNNWAVNASKSATGHALLADDPHLKVHLPSIWYEIHLLSDEQNVYGATIPGAPGIVIGFNSSISWGVTNAGRDTRNWYEVKFTDKNRNAIWIDSQKIATQKIVEKIAVRGGYTIEDTIIVTEFGRIIYDENFSQEPQPKNLALSWTHNLPSNEILTFYRLNKAKNLDDYFRALETFYSPGQNFAYADIEGNVAIVQQGLFPNTPKDFDKFILDGSQSKNKMNKFIPISHNPKSVNPPRGFVSSANQHPTDKSYPYYYSSGDFEAYRNRRINEVLGAKDKLTVEDMKALQSDDFFYMASEYIPLLLSLTADKIQQLTPEQQQYLANFKKWDFRASATSKEATLAELWLKALDTAVWDELISEKLVFDFPKPIVLYQLLKKNPTHKFFDHKSTPEIENANEIAWISLKKALEKYRAQEWWNFKGTQVEHLAFIPAFGHYGLKTGGNKHIVNAIWKDWAPSWRMIVEMNPMRPVGYICFPGGNSGNPASKYFDYQISDWTLNKYRKVPLTFKPSEIESMEVLIFEI